MFKIKHGFVTRKNPDQVKALFYKRWCYMKTRCLNQNRSDWKNYGGRGITISDNWMEFENFKGDMFESFKKHLAQHGPVNTTLDRIDVNKNYCKENCVWSTRLKQNRNRRDNVHVIYNGQKYAISEIAQTLNRPRSTIYSWISRGFILKTIN